MSASRSPVPIRFRRIGVKPVKWGIYSTLDLGGVYINLDFGWHYRWKLNFYIGKRWRA